MAFNIEQFKSNFGDGGARPNLFQVTLNFPSTVTTPPTTTPFMIRAAQIPSSTIAQVDVPYQGRQVRVAGNRTFEPWTVTILNAENFSVRNSLEKWMSSINGHESNIGQDRASSYKADAIVKHFGKDGRELSNGVYNFVGLFPTELSTIELAWDSNDVIEEFTCTFAFDYWQHAGVVTT